MADTQADSNVFSVRIVSIDYYMAAPISGLDFCYSSFQGGKVNEVPVIRIYGSTPTGQKTCLHIHKPSKYTPCVLEGDAHTQAVFLALEKALKIDYNLYGMGHMHLSKMKFRHPVPDTFSPWKSDGIGMQNQNMDKLTCMPTDFQADPNCDASLSSPIWISSTIPADWIWQFPSEFEASSHQDEEYERTGMRDGAMPSDPSKPLPDDVLRTLSLATDEGNLVGLGHTNTDNIDGEPLKYSKEKEIMGSLSPQGSIREEEIPTEGRDTSIQPAIIETLNPKAVDKEALGLLRWLAMSQAAEYINSDDELVCETVLSPFGRGAKRSQQTNFHEAHEVKAAHSDSSMYGKLPLLYSSDSSSQASRAKDGKFGSHGKVGDEARIGAITENVDFTVTSALVGNNVPLVDSSPLKGSASSLIVTQSSLCDDCDKAQSFLPDDCEKDLPESGSTFYVKPILDHLYQETLESSMQKGVHLVMGGDAYTQAESFALEIALKLKGQQENFCEAYEVKAAHSDFSMYEVGDEARIGAITAPMDFTVTGAPGGNNVALVDSSPLKCSASSLIGTPSSLPHDCDKVQSFLLDDCDKDLPESGSGSHVKPILDHLYQENPRILDRERSAFGDGVTTIMQDGKSKPTPLSQSGFRDPASVGGGEQLTLLSIEVQAESSRDLRSDPRFDAINVIALAIQNDTDSIPEVYVHLRHELSPVPMNSSSTGTSFSGKKGKMGTAALTVVIGRNSKLVREMQHLAAICQHCGGVDWVVESGVKCSSLACSVFYERWKVTPTCCASEWEGKWGVTVPVDIGMQNGRTASPSTANNPAPEQLQR
uniref:DNA-directed DNA polymerase family B exonuclease domain-containing protein n=1 Tax=Fagus sylvatica TaxID=28930 RepID=A0A2N9FLM1_FAGSY